MMTGTEVAITAAISYLWLAGGAFIASQMEEDGIADSLSWQLFTIAVWPFIMAFAFSYQAFMYTVSAVKTIKGIFQ